MNSAESKKRRSADGRYETKDAIDLADLRNLANIGCTFEEAAAFFDIRRETLWRWMQVPAYAQAWQNGKLLQRYRLREYTWNYIEKMNGAGAHVLIHMRKHLFGEKDKILFSVEDALRHIDELTDTQLEELIKIQRAVLAELRKRDSGEDEIGH